MLFGLDPRSTKSFSKDNKNPKQATVKTKKKQKNFHNS